LTADEVLVFAGGTVVLPDEVAPDGVVVCEEGRIAGAGPRDEVFVPEGARVVDVEGGFVCPGFVEIHTHGGGGADVMDGTLEAVVTVARTHLRHGTTTLLPTTSTASPERIRRLLDLCIEARDTWSPERGARIGGAHLYGPYFAPDKLGCHPAGGRRDPDPDEYLELLDLGIVRVATCAAELPGAVEFYREASGRGCLVTCGHSDAGWDELRRGFDAGLRHVDHFWCAMSSIPSVRERFGFPMRGSMAEFTLMHEEMSTEVIADLEHLAPELLEFAYRIKGADRLCLVTDASRALDMPPGEYVFGPLDAGEPFTSDGRVGRVGDTLASSVTPLDAMVRNMVHAAGVPLADAVRMASLTPAERAGLDEVGSLEEGKLADLVILSGSLEVERVFLGGGEALPGR
jgi:N-acetylglucosamine-6-phosphate deacetylase